MSEGHSVCDVIDLHDNSRFLPFVLCLSRGPEMIIFRTILIIAVVGPMAAYAHIVPRLSSMIPIITHKLLTGAVSLDRFTQ